MRSAYAQPQERRPPFESYEAILVLLIVGCAWFASYVAQERYHFTVRQLVELAGYIVIALAAVCWPVYRLLTARRVAKCSGRIRRWLCLPKKTNGLRGKPGGRTRLSSATTYYGKPWLWPDQSSSDARNCAWA